MKKLAILVTAVILLAAVSASAEFQIYPLAGRVVEIDNLDDTVTFEDGSGLLWTFYGVEDYAIGDIVACIIWHAGSQKLYDHEIVDVVYAGVF